MKDALTLPWHPTRGSRIAWPRWWILGCRRHRPHHFHDQSRSPQGYHSDYTASLPKERRSAGEERASWGENLDEGREEVKKTLLCSAGRTKRTPGRRAWRMKKGSWRKWRSRSGGSLCSAERSQTPTYMPHVWPCFHLCDTIKMISPVLFSHL